MQTTKQKINKTILQPTNQPNKNIHYKCKVHHHLHHTEFKKKNQKKAKKKIQNPELNIIPLSPLHRIFFKTKTKTKN